MGWLQVKNKDLKNGIDNLQKALSLNPDNNDILIKIGEAYLLHEGEEGGEEAIGYLK